MLALATLACPRASCLWDQDHPPQGQPHPAIAGKSRFMPAQHRPQSKANTGSKVGGREAGESPGGQTRRGKAILGSACPAGWRRSSRPQSMRLQAGQNGPARIENGGHRRLPARKTGRWPAFASGDRTDRLGPGKAAEAVHRLAVRRPNIHSPWLQARRQVVGPSNLESRSSGAGRPSRRPASPTQQRHPTTVLTPREQTPPARHQQWAEVDQNEPSPAAGAHPGQQPLTGASIRERRQPTGCRGHRNGSPSPRRARTPPVPRAQQAQQATLCSAQPTMAIARHLP